MKYALLFVAMVLGGCGDTVNQYGTQQQSSPVTIKSANFHTYSTTTYSTVDSSILFKNYGISGSITYEGDIQGNTITVKCVKPDGTYSIMRAIDSYLTPNHVYNFYANLGGIDPISEYNIKSNSIYLTLTNPHGQDSNSFLVEVK